MPFRVVFPRMVRGFYVVVVITNLQHDGDAMLSKKLYDFIIFQKEIKRNFEKQLNETTAQALAPLPCKPLL